MIMTSHGLQMQVELQLSIVGLPSSIDHGCSPGDKNHGKLGVHVFVCGNYGYIWKASLIMEERNHRTAPMEATCAATTHLDALLPLA